MAGFSDYVIRLLVDNSHLARDLQNSRNLMERFSAVGRSATDMLGRFAGAVGLSYSGIQLFNTAINSNSVSLNAWNDTIGTLTTSVDNFFSSLITGDWSVFENGIINAISLSKQFSKELRELKLNLNLGDIQLNESENTLDDLEAIINSPSKSKKDKEAAYKQFQETYPKAKKDVQDLVANTEGSFKKLFSSKGISIGDTSVRKLLLRYMPTFTDEGKALEQFSDAWDTIYGSKELKSRYLKNGNYKAAEEQEKAEKDAARIVHSLEKEYPDIKKAYHLRRKFTDDELTKLAEDTSKMQDYQARLITIENKNSGIISKFDNNGHFIEKIEKGGAMPAPKSYTNVTIPTSMIPVKFEIPETTLKELEDKRSAIVKQMNNANQEDYVKLKVKLDETDLDIKDFKNGKYGKIKGIEATPVEIKSSLSVANSEVDYSDSIEGLNALASSLQTVSNLTNEGASAWLTYGANILTTVAAAIPAITALTVAKDQESNANIKAAATGAAASLASIPFVGPILAIAAVASVLAALMAIPKFATGGIVGGNKPFGDMNLARVNSGEMILNNHLQRNLFNLLNNGASASNGGKVEFKIQGRELVGVLKNYNNKISKVQ